MNTKFRVLQLGTKNFGIGGISTFVFQLGKFQNKNKVIFDYFILNDKIDSFYKREIEKKGGEAYLFKKYKLNILNLFFGIKNLRKMKHHDIYHIHASVAYIALCYLICCKLLKVNKIIIHSHSDGIEGKFKILKRLFHELSKRIMLMLKKETFACSKEAAEWMFCNQDLSTTIIIKNGIEVEKFLYNKSWRNYIRKELNMEENFILGHVGRYTDAKNHDFILRIYKELLKRNKKYRLLLVGIGNKTNLLNKKLEQYNIKEGTKIIKRTKEVSKYLSAMDSFIFPSKFEGFGIAVIEAQASGLLVFASENLPKITQVTSNIVYLDLEKGINYWCDIIEERSFNFRRKNLRVQFKNLEYDIKKVAKNLEKRYKIILKRR